MKPTLFGLCALLAAMAWAQPAAQPEGHAAPAPAAGRVALGGPAPKADTAARARAPERTVTAAGSVLTLTDGQVSRARLAQIVPPAPGFVYER